MLSVFPSLLDFQFFAPLFLRVVVGFIFISMGLSALRGERQKFIAIFEAIGVRPARIAEQIFSYLQIAGGALLIIGAYTQLAALFFLIISMAEYLIEYRQPSVLKNNISFYLLLAAVSLSLLMLGPGVLSIDLPL